MHVAFRADASPQIGTGHVMRCLALAEALQATGAECAFLCRPNGLGDLGNRIRMAGHQLIELPEDLPDLWQADAEFCSQALAGQAALDWLIVDHYALAADWENAMRGRTRKILVIDDLANRPHACDLLLDANLHRDAAERYAGMLPAHCHTLLGPRYALLRPEFSRHRSAALQRPLPPQATRLLVMFGGADRDNLTGQTLALLAELKPALHIDVVIGPLYPYRDSLTQALTALPAITLHQSPAHLTELMAAADFTIGSPGTTSWERCALGLPAIAISVARNQEAMAQALAEHGCHLYLGPAETLDRTQLIAAIRLLTGNLGVRQALRQQAAALCDGRGSIRLQQQLRENALEIRPASENDARLVHVWRNDPRVRQFAFDPKPIDWELHQRWFENTLRNPERHLLLVCQQQSPVACLRFDRQGTVARISIFLDPERIGQGLAVPVLRAGTDWLKKHHPAITAIHAEVMADNRASQQAFLGAGYRLEHQVYILDTKLAALPAKDTA